MVTGGLKLLVVGIVIQFFGLIIGPSTSEECSGSGPGYECVESTDPSLMFLIIGTGSLAFLIGLVWAVADWRIKKYISKKNISEKKLDHNDSKNMSGKKSDHDDSNLKGSHGEWWK